MWGPGPDMSGGAVSRQGSRVAPSYRTLARATTSDGPMLPARSIAAIETGPPTLARVIVIVGLRTVSVLVPILTR